ncbi:hypothetical protein PENSPDRAFT_40960 [Peniophora sp. CONT]|nr:hypothetical protein PENSPDRAFT_40960 [Peniophora sp. CONT]
MCQRSLKTFVRLDPTCAKFIESNYCNAVTTVIFGAEGEKSLSIVEEALARATTLMMWSAAVDDGTLTTYTTQAPFSSRTVKKTRGNVEVTYYEYAGQVQVDTLYLTLGTVLAILLTALGSYIMAMAVSRRRAPIDDVDLLGIMALNNSLVAAQLSHQQARYDMDSTLGRRQAGNFKVTVARDGLVPVEGKNYDSGNATQHSLLPESDK